MNEVKQALLNKLREEVREQLSLVTCGGCGFKEAIFYPTIKVIQCPECKYREVRN